MEEIITITRDLSAQITEMYSTTVSSISYNKFTKKFLRISDFLVSLSLTKKLWFMDLLEFQIEFGTVPSFETVNWNHYYCHWSLLSSVTLIYYTTSHFISSDIFRNTFFSHNDYNVLQNSHFQRTKHYHFVLEFFNSLDTANLYISLVHHSHL